MAIPTTDRTSSGSAFAPFAIGTRGLRADDPRFISDGICLFTQDGTMLVACIADTTTYTVPSTCRIIGPEAFAYRRCLTRVNLPEGLERIDDNAFFSCNALERADLPSSLRSIGNRAFFCTSITRFRIPKGLEHLGDAAIVSLAKLKENRVAECKRARKGAGLAFEAGYAGSVAEEDACNPGLPISVEPGNPWLRIENGFLCDVSDGQAPRVVFYAGNEREVTIPPGTVHVCDYALMGSSNTRVINVPASLRSIGDRALTLTRPPEYLRVKLPDGREMVLHPAPKLPGMYACNRAFRQPEFDARQLARECDASLVYTQATPERDRRMIARLDNGVLLSDAMRERFVRIISEKLEETLRRCARTDDLETLRSLVNARIVNRSNVARAIDIANAEGGVPACHLLMEASRQLRGSRLSSLAL